MQTKEQIAAEHKRLSAEYQRLLSAMVEICFKHDPIGINFEVNRNEYEPEVQTILPRLRNCKNRDDALKVVHEEFQKWFGLDAGPIENYLSLAEEIWNVWNERTSSREM